MKLNLIEFLVEGFDWNYYFKNYSMDDDVHLPASFPSSVRSTIMQFISREVPGLLIDKKMKIILQLSSRAGMDSNEIHQTLDLIITNQSLDYQLYCILRLPSNSNLLQDHYQRIRNISESFSEELRNQILQLASEANENTKELRMKLARGFRRARERRKFARYNR